MTKPTFFRILVPVVSTLVVGGCISPEPRDDHLDEEIGLGSSHTNLLNLTFNLTAGLRLPGPAYGALYALVLGHDNCAAFGTREDGQAFKVRGGSATLEWNNSDAKASLRLIAENLTVDMESPSGPSPIRMDFEEIDVTFSHRLSIMARLDSPESGSTELPVRMHVSFEYEGDEVWARPSSCQFI